MSEVVYEVFDLTNDDNDGLESHPTTKSFLEFVVKEEFEEKGEDKSARRAHSNEVCGDELRELSSSPEQEMERSSNDSRATKESSSHKNNPTNGNEEAARRLTSSESNEIVSTKNTPSPLLSPEKNANEKSRIGLSRNISNTEENGNGKSNMEGNGDSTMKNNTKNCIETAPSQKITNYFEPRTEESLPSAPKVTKENSFYNDTSTNISNEIKDCSREIGNEEPGRSLTSFESNQSISTKNTPSPALSSEKNSSGMSRRSFSNGNNNNNNNNNNNIEGDSTTKTNIEGDSTTKTNTTGHTKTAPSSPALTNPPIMNIREYHRIGQAVQAAWLKDIKDPTEKIQWYRGIIKGYETIQHDGPFGDIRRYDVKFDDGDECKVEDQWVMSADDYDFLCNKVDGDNKLEEKWGIIHYVADGCIVEDEYARRQGWYRTNITNDEILFTSLMGAIRARDDVFVENHGCNVKSDDLVLSDEWEFYAPPRCAPKRLMGVAGNAIRVHRNTLNCFEVKSSLIHVRWARRRVGTDSNNNTVRAKGKRGTKRKQNTMQPIVNHKDHSSEEAGDDGHCRKQNQSTAKIRSTLRNTETKSNRTREVAHVSPGHSVGDGTDDTNPRSAAEEPHASSQQISHSSLSSTPTPQTDRSVRTSPPSEVSRRQQQQQQQHSRPQNPIRRPIKLLRHKRESLDKKRIEFDNSFWDAEKLFREEEIRNREKFFEEESKKRRKFDEKQKKKREEFERHFVTEHKKMKDLEKEVYNVSKMKNEG